jgi:hypothetical protein
MGKVVRRVVTGLAVVLAAGCLKSSQSVVKYPAYAVAVPPSTEPNAEGWTITLSAATVAFGPAYFCAASSGSATLCEAPSAELRSIGVVDLLDPSPQEIGTVDGLSGELHSASYDFGIGWTTTQAEATVWPENSLGHSAYFEGEARRGDDVIPFVATVDIAPQYRGQRAIPTTAAQGSVSEDVERLEVHFDPGAWLAKVNFDRHTPGEAIEITPGTPDHNAIVLGMNSTATPQLTWIDGSK